MTPYSLKTLSPLSMRTGKEILLDLMMPDLHGWDVYQRIRTAEASRDTPVIIVTAKAESIDWALGMQVKAVDDYVTKPFNSKQLLTSIENVLSS